MRLALLALAACSLGPPATGDGISTEPDPTDPGGPCDQTDVDGDGVDACDDCDDADANRHPGAVETCDGLDDDCDGAPVPDELVDADGDGAPDCALCDQTGYWAGTRDLSGQALVDALNALSSDQTCADYSTETTWMFTVLDKRADGMVECVYTGRTTPVGSEKPDPTDMNTEHSWPQSLGAEYPPAECDLHHLYPTDASANSARGNYPFGEVTSVESWWDETGESALGTTSTGETAWEPRDVHKGNVARSMLYFAMRYGYTIDPAELALYQAWNHQDPVDAAEIARTLAIRDHRGEANPYVVCPDLADRL